MPFVADGKRSVMSHNRSAKLVNAASTVLGLRITTRHVFSTDKKGLCSAESTERICTFPGQEGYLEGRL